VKSLPTAFALRDCSRFGYLVLLSSSRSKYPIFNTHASSGKTSVGHQHQTAKMLDFDVSPMLLARRRGDRISAGFAAIAHGRFWHFSDLAKCPT
jgi:hypothetical protein